MSQFLENAQQIFEAAENSASLGSSSAEYTILLGSSEGCGIHMIADSDWSLPALRQAHGAQAAYRVSHVDGRVAVDGRDGQRTCHMEAVAASKVAQFLLNAAPPWHSQPSSQLVLTQ